MSCANFQELLAGSGTSPNTTTAVDFTPANIDFPYDSDDDLRLDIYNYEDQQWVNVPLATGATIDVGGAGDVFYAWETYQTNGQTGVRTILATSGTTPALPSGGTASHPLAPANNNYPVEGGTGVNVRLYRQTSIEAGEMPAYFYPGASIRAQDLNDNFEALRKVVEESNCATNNINDGAAQLDARYWNKLDDTLRSGDTWSADDNHVVTAARGDERWLQGGAAGDVIGGPGIDIDTGTVGQVTISADLTADGGLEFSGTGNAQEIRVDAGNGIVVNADGVNVDDGNGIVVNADGVNVGAGNGITVNADDVAINLNATNPGLAVDANGLRTDGNQTNIGTVQFGSGDTYTFPTSDGTANQVLVTDGSGSLSWATNTADNTTYDLTATDNGDDANINLVDSDSNTDTVTIAAGTNITIDHSGSTITINSTGGGAGGVDVEDDGADIVSGATTLNFTGGGVTVTDAGSNEATINIPTPTAGGATFRGTVNVDDDNTLPATSGQQNPNDVAVGDAFTVEADVASGDVTTNWQTVLQDSWTTADGDINSGDVIICTTAAAVGNRTDARYNLIRTGGVNSLQSVTNAGNTTTNGITLNNTGFNSLILQTNRTGGDSQIGSVRFNDTDGNQMGQMLGHIGSSLSFETGGTARMRINNTGVLIGGTLPGTPNTTLNTNGNATFAGTVQSGGNALNGTDAGVLLRGNNGMIHVTSANSSSAIFHGFTEGDATPTSTILANGGATFADGNFEIQQDSQLVITNGTGNDANTAIEIRNDADDATNIALRYDGSSAFEGNLNINDGEILLRANGNGDFTGSVVAGNNADSGGSAGEDGCTLNAGGVVQAMRQAAGSNVWASYVSGNSDANIVMTAGGSATFNGNVNINDGSNLVLQNTAEDQTISINADDCTATYTVTLPPTAPTANGQVLSVASGTTDAELQWADPGAGATPNLDQVTDEGNLTTNIIGIGDDTDANDCQVLLHPNAERSIELCTGTEASSVSSGNRIGTIRWSAENGTGLGAQINVDAAQSWTNSVMGSQMNFGVTPNAGSSPVTSLQINQNGTIRQIGRSNADRDQFVCGLQDGGNLAQGGNGISLLVSGANSGGTRLGIRRGSGTSGAASYLQMRKLNDSSSVIWVDNNSIVRLSSNINDVGGTGGEVVGSQTSDRRVKKDITSYVSGLDVIEQLQPVNFRYQHGDDRLRTGFIAQDVQSIIPEAVYDTGIPLDVMEPDPEEPDRMISVGQASVDEPTKLAMDYVEIIPALVNAAKELSAKVQYLETQVGLLSAINAEEPVAEPEPDLIPNTWTQEQRLAAMKELLDEYNANR